MTQFPPVPGASRGGSSTPYGVTYPDQLPATEYGLLGTSGITALQVAIANRNGARVDIPIVGDSITEGQGATAFTGRWIAQANRAIRAAYPTTANGGLGFIPIQSTGETSYTWPVTLATGNGGTFEAFDLGPVRYAAHCFGATSFTWTAPTGTTSVKVMFYDAAVAGSFSYKVGSGSATTVSNASSLTEILTASITITSGQVLTITWVSGDVFIDGIMHYAGDESSGITVQGCGHFGWTADDWNSPEADGLNWAQCFSNGFPNAAALGIMLGINDGDTGNGDQTAVQFQADMEALIGTIKGASGTLAKLPLLLIVEYSPNITLADPGGWPAYAAAVRNAAAANANTHVIDLSYRMPSIGSDWSSGELYADNYHPANLGHALLGEIVSAGMRIA